MITDPVVGGLYLIRAAIRSPNFQDGLLGWTINQDGSAQFFNVVIIGNDLKVLGPNGSAVELTTVGGIAEILVLPGGGNVNAGSILSGVSGTGQPQLIMQSPQQTLTTPNSRATLFLAGANATSAGASASITADSAAIIGLAGTSGAGSAGLQVGNSQGLPANVNLFAVNSSIGMDGGGFSLANNITLVTQTLSLIGPIKIDDGTNRMYMLTATDNFDCSATQSLGGAYVAIPGMAHTYATSAPGTKWEAFVSIDAQLNATAGNVMSTQLVVAGVAQALTLDQGPRVSTSDTATRSWSGTFAAGGALSFSVNSKITGGGGLGNNVLIGASTLHVNLYQ